MDRRFILFLCLSIILMFGWMTLMNRIYGPPEGARQDPDAVAQPDKPEDDAQVAAVGAEPDAEQTGGEAIGAETPEDEQPGEEPEEPPVEVEPQVEVPTKIVTLGSGDPNGPFRQLVTATNRGASIVRIELPDYRDIQNHYGYLGHLELTPTSDGAGCRVRAVGPGTPAAEAGLAVDDVIVRANDSDIRLPADLEAVLRNTKPGEVLDLVVERDGAQVELQPTLRRQPLSLIQPQGDAPPSFLFWISSLDGKEQSPDDLDSVAWQLRNGNWEVVEADAENAVFRMRLADAGLEVIKRFGLVRVPDDERMNRSFHGYHVKFALEVRNVGDESRRFEYKLEGPNGLPDEGAWYAYKISPSWGGVGLRDVAVRWLTNDGDVTTLFSAQKVAEGEKWSQNGGSLVYIGVDAQYFSVIAMPQKGDNPTDIWYTRSEPIRIGPEPPKAKRNTANTSFEVLSKTHELAPGDDALVQSFEVFAGPKRPDLLDGYGLGNLAYYGWFGWVAKPLLMILHFFYGIFGNFALAIIMLTVLVRLCMFPLSRKQVQSAQKMQELQPEIRRIAEKYKKDLEKRSKAQQDLFKKHNYNPLGGCLVLFVQLPIFMGLYRSLSVDVELRDAPMFWEGFPWAQNLAAPDMLFRWDGFMPQFVVGWLGPYFNLLPLITVGLFLWQQKMFMPPPTDDQARLQQKIMQYMMIFMGFIFFKVASGLCLYFIASSLWGIAERKVLPRTTPQTAGAGGASGGAAGSGGAGSGGGGGGGSAKPRRPVAPSGANGNGAPTKKKRKKQRGRR